MALEIKFDNPKILRGYLDQALTQVGLEEARHRIIGGRDGGLAYTLFKDPVREILSEFRATSRSDKPAVKENLDAVEKYIQSAEKHAKRYGFGLIAIRKVEKFGTYLSLESCIDPGGIGGPIESPERFEEFLKMVKEVRGDLDEQYKLVETAFKSLR